MDYSDYQPKQHINLSFNEWDIIENDIIAFTGSKPENKSGFINTIILSFIENNLFPCNITEELRKLEKNVKSRLGATDIPADIKLKITEDILSEYLNSIMSKLNFEKGAGKKFDLNHECLLELENLRGILFDETGKKNIPFASRGKLINTILKEYASLSYALREQTYYYKTINTLKKHIKNNSAIHIRVSTAPNQLFMIAPYKILNSDDQLHTYLVGKNIDENARNRYVSFRISNISFVQKIPGLDAEITHDEIASIQQALTDKGVQFLSDELTETVKIKLTEKGISNLHQISHLRPKEKEHSGNVYTFYCTPFQAWVYFSKFYGDAEIIYPVSLRERFISTYQKALDSYIKS